MDRADIKQLLEGYYRYKEGAEKLRAKVEILEAQATKKTASYDPNKGSIPKDNPKPSKVERNAIKIAEAKEQIEQLEMLVAAADNLLSHLKPHQRYLVRCLVCNGMKPEEFSRREGIKPLTVKVNLEKIYKKLETV
jgi:DNA-binding CsgD family transcriptional regulator